MIEVIYIPNRFEPHERLRRMCEYRNKGTIADYVRQLDGAPRRISPERHVVIVSGEVVDSAGTLVKNHSQIIITNKIEEPVTFIVASAKAIWGAIVSYAVYAAAHPFVAAAFLMTAYSVYSALTTRTRNPSFTGTGGIDDGSPTYAWEGITNTRGVGNPIPIIYGTHRAGGHILNEYISQIGDQSYYNVLIGICEGEIDDIDDIMINGNPIANFTSVEIVKCYGTDDDDVIPHFEDLHNVYSLGVNLTKNSAYTITTQDSDVDAFELVFSIPGLFQQSENTGEIQSWSVVYRVRYRENGEVTWIDLGNTTISKKTRSAVKHVFRKEGLTPAKFDIEVTRMSDDSDFQRFGDLTLQSIDEIKSDDLQYNYTAKLGLRALAVDQLSGSAPNVTFTVRGRKINIPRVTVFSTGADVPWEDYYWDPDYDSGTGAFRLFSDDAVLYWDGTSWIETFCANPVWCLRDLITNSRFGIGGFVSASGMDVERLTELSRYCDERVDDGSGGYEKRFFLDVVIDSTNSAVDLINQLAAVFQGFAFWSRDYVNLGIDKPEEPVQLFGMGNILSGSFNMSWGSFRDTPNVIEVMFCDREKDYENETIEIVDEASIAAGDPVRRTSMRIFCTRASQAVRTGRYAMKVAQHIRRSASLRVGIDAIAVQVGDIVGVSHDVVQWGFSGRVKSGATDSVVPVDRDLVLETGRSYVLRVRFDDDTIAERAVDLSPGTYDEITVSPAFDAAPAAGAVYAFGEESVNVKPFRVIGLSRKGSSDEVDVSLIEYSASVYDDSAVVLPESKYSALNFGIPAVTDLALDEHLVIGNDGSFESAIDVYFSRPDSSDHYINRYREAVVYVSDNDGASWDVAGRTSGEHFIIHGGVAVGRTYKVAVVSVSANGEEAALSAAVSDSILVLGKAKPPADVQNFDVQQRGSWLNMRWDPVPDKDLARYEIRYGTSWLSAQPIAQKVDITEFDYPVGSIGSQTFLIKAIDTSGNESAVPGFDEITVTPPPEMNFAVTLDPWMNISKYTLTDITLEQRNLFDPDYARPVIALTSGKDWADLEGSGWDDIEADGDVNVEGPYAETGTVEQRAEYAFDLGTTFEFNIVIDLSYLAPGGGSIASYLSTSEDGSTWTSFELVSASANYRARFVRFRYVLTTLDTDHSVHFYSGQIFINAANVKVDFGRDVAIADSGTAIRFRDDFTAIPRITCLAIKNGVLGVIEVTTISSTGMTLKVRNLADTAYIGTAEVDWECKGS